MIEQSVGNGINRLQEISDKLPGNWSYAIGGIGLLLLISSLNAISKNLKRIADRLDAARN
jgi:hypothetical protein